MRSQACLLKSSRFSLPVNTLQETSCEYVTGNGPSRDNGRRHAETQVRATLRPRGCVHCKAPRI
eukprot:3909482-Prymnesium_polylepis.1